MATLDADTWSLIHSPRAVTDMISGDVPVEVPLHTPRGKRSTATDAISVAIGVLLGVMSMISILRIQGRIDRANAAAVSAEPPSNLPAGWPAAPVVPVSTGVARLVGPPPSGVAPAPPVRSMRMHVHPRKAKPKANAPTGPSPDEVLETLREAQLERPF